jgi:tetratricopeptide (TPR) repeat protein
MATKRRKKNIKEDQLVTMAVELSQWTQAHLNQVIAGVVVLVGIIAVLVFTAQSRQGASREGERMMSSAMGLMQQGEYESAKASFQQIYQRYGGKSGAAARFFRAECDLRQGQFAQALAGYDDYLASADKFPWFRASALAGKAVSYEGLENYAEAAKTLGELTEVVDAADPRYLDAAIQAGEFFAMTGDLESSAKYYHIVAEKGSGEMRDRAEVALELMGR